MWEYRESESVAWFVFESDVNKTVAFCVTNWIYGSHRFYNLQVVTQHNKIRDITYATSRIYQSFQRNIVHGDFF